MDTFQGYYKDETNGICDWRFLAGLYPLLHTIIKFDIHYRQHTTGMKVTSTPGALTAIGGASGSGGAGPETGGASGSGGAGPETGGASGSGE